jgi:hypothetical protein
MGIEVYHKDIETSVDWKTAVRRATRIDYNGGGWRLPTIDELRFMNTLYLIGVGDFHNRNYWSGDIIKENDLSWAYEIGSEPWKWRDDIDRKYAVRPVRDIISDI